MENLLTPISTTYKSKGAEQVKPYQLPALVRNPTSPESALDILRSEPDFETVRATLSYLARDAPSASGFIISSPSPQAAQIIKVLVTDTVPNYWTVFGHASTNHKPKKSGSVNDLLLSCLRNVTALNAVLLRLKILIQESKESKTAGTSIAENLKILVDIINTILLDENLAFEIWEGIQELNPPQQKLLWTEYTLLTGAGKLLATVAEAMDVISECSKEALLGIWISKGSLYSSWLAGSIVAMTKKLLGNQFHGYGNVAELISKSLRLGYTEAIIQKIVSGLLLQREEDMTGFKELRVKEILNYSGPYEQRTILTSVLKMISKRYLGEAPSIEKSDWWKTDASLVSASAKLIGIVLDRNSNRRSALISWLTSSFGAGAGAGESVGIRRAAIAALSEEKEDLESVLEKSIALFGDQLYIKHAPILQQEAHTQVLLLAAGYVHRMSPIKLHMLLRSGPYLSSISNRLASTSMRARLLGMIVGEAMSSLIDKADGRMDFKMEELQSDDAKWYKGLIEVQDNIGSLEPLKSESSVTTPAKRPPSQKNPPAKHPALSNIKVVVAIEEVGSGGESEDDEFIAHEKPDSDEEDSDEDAAAVTRNKPTAPVYIRDLITFLRNTESYDHQHLALTSVSLLIRRKASFGTEVTDHVEELATLLVGMQDKYDLPDFTELRIQGMIAVLLAQPSKMGPWFAKTFFHGDYSLAQRSAVLATLSLSARELGGFKDDESILKSKASTSFPSKILPPKMHDLYASPQQKELLKSGDDSAINELSQQLSMTMIQPLAASVADKMSGPDILKVRTFSSRMEVEKKRPKPTSNTLAKIAAEAFFLPLTTRFGLHFKKFGATNVIFSPLLLSNYLRTLSIIMYAAGPTAAGIQSMTFDFWELLLGLRTAGLERGDKTVLEGVLLGFMTIIDISMETSSRERELVEGFQQEMLNTHHWVEGLYERLAGGSEEDERVRMLAAGVLVRIREVVEKYRARLTGELSTYR